MCQCVCGKQKAINASSLRSGVTKSCGCKSKELENAERIKRLVNTKYGKWTIIKPTENRDSSGAIKYLVRCECGNEKELILNVITSGRSSSCGCGSSSKGEAIVSAWLIKNKIPYQKEFVIKDFLYSGGGTPRFDFCLLNSDNSLRALVEFDGKQHYISSSWGGEIALNDRKIKDAEKDEYCKLNNIKLIRIKYTDIEKIDLILKGEILNG